MRHLACRFIDRPSTVIITIIMYLNILLTILFADVFVVIRNAGRVGAIIVIKFMIITIIIVHVTVVHIRIGAVIAISMIIDIATDLRKVSFDPPGARVRKL